jgi:maltooligosyltrehalose trehalohydrolase
VTLLLDGGFEVPFERHDRGYWDVVAEGVEPGRRYRLRLDDGPALPDPASRFQPDDVHGPSAVTDGAFGWRDAGWKGLPLEALVIWEAHVGTATPSGTFDEMVNLLDHLHDLGVTALEVMPVGQFPGSRNWGYDGVLPYAVQHSYGGPDGLKRLVEACHDPRRRLQPPGPGGEPSRGVRAVLHRPLHHPVGPGDQLRRRRER